MSYFDHKRTVKVKRLPFIDKTNVMPTKHSTSVAFNCILSKKGLLEDFASIDPKFKLKSKVHLQFNSIIEKKPSSTAHPLQSRNAAKGFTLIDPKFKLKPKVHLQFDSIIETKLSSTSHPLQSRKVANDHISNDPKFKLIPKVHLKRLNIKNTMPNFVSPKNVSKKTVRTHNLSQHYNKTSKKEINCVEGSMHKCVPRGGDGSIKNIQNRCKEVSGLGENILVGNDITGRNVTNSSLDSKFYQKIVVQVNKCKELEQALKRNNKSPEVVKKVHFMHDVNLIPKFDKALRRRRTKNYAELSLQDTSSPEKKLEQSYREHNIPVYLQDVAIKQPDRDNDPFQFVSETPSRDPKKKRGRGRPVKEMKSPLQFKKRGRGRPFLEEPSDSDSSLYDRSMHSILKTVRLKLSPKKSKYRKRTKLKQNNNVRVITNQMKNGQIQIAPAKKVASTEININNHDLVVSNSKVKAGPPNMQIQIPSRSEQQSGILNSRLGPSRDVNERTLQLLTKDIHNIRRRISRISSDNIRSAQKTNDCDKYFGFDDDSDDNFNDISRVLPKPGPSGIMTLNRIKPARTMQILTSLTSTPLPNIQKRSLTETKRQTSPKRVHIISNILLSPSTHTKSKNLVNTQNITMPTIAETPTIDTSCAVSVAEDNGNFLGFDDSLPASTSASLISKTSQHPETPIHDFVDSVKHTESGFRGFANMSSRMNVNTRKKRTSSRTAHPWRSDRLNIRRNPHFLTLKDTSLPCYNQEMILEPKLLERPQTPMCEAQSKSNKIQTSILDFVSSNKVNNESTPTKKHHNMSLFDDDDFSPIKNKSPNKDENDEKLQTSKAKKIIFGVRRKKNETSPLRERNVGKFGVDNYFGFDSPETSKHAVDKENVRLTRNRVKRAINVNEEALPMRVPLKQLKKVRKEAVEELLDIIDLEKDVAEEPTVMHNENSQDEDLPPVGLFEDLAELKPPPRIYERKRTKRTRAVSVDTDIVEEEKEKPKRKRKDMLTPAEEEEFNKWASAFNAMCNEVDKHDLEMI